MASLYKPYDSASETSSDSGSTTSSEESIPGALQNNLVAQQDAPSLSGTKFSTKETTNTTLYVINSRDRDTRVYPQPTFFTIRLPRVFRNVKTINLSQLNLLNSFFNFSQAKGNTFMYVYEQGRTRIDSTTGNTINNSIRIQIRDGTYNTDDLVLELTNALNSTPIFSDITLGNFIDYFQSSGDFTALFNIPGSVVYNSFTQTYERNRTINDIVARYFQIVQNVGTVSYTYDQCLVAYYYPIIKEMIIESPTPRFVVPEQLPTGFSSWYDYIIFAFEGLNDKYIQEIVRNPFNQQTFNTYRDSRTFNNFLVNKYNCTYNTKQGRLIITAPSLNDSIQTDLNTQYNQYLNSLVASNGTFANVADFQARYNTVNNSNSALIEFYNFIQAQFANYFGVDFGKYSAEFYGDSNNEIAIYNTKNTYGWNLSLTPQVSANVITSNARPEQCPQYWSNITFLTADVQESQFISTLTIPEFTNNKLVFSNSGEGQFGYSDVYFRMDPTKYARATFQSRCRQNVNFMTLPRRIENRTDANDLIYNFGPEEHQTPLLFKSTMTGTTVLVDVTNNPLFNMYTVKQNMFQGPDYMRSLNRWLAYMTPQVLAGTLIQPGNQNFGQRPPLSDISLTSFRSFIYFQVDADQYLIEPRAHFNIALFVETQNGLNFPVPIKITWYKDRAGLMADASGDGNNIAENPRHYFKQQIFGSDLSGARMVVDVNNHQTSYFMVQFASLENIPSSIPLRVYALRADQYGVYRTAVKTDYYDMPFKDLPLLSDQYTPASDVFESPIKSIYDSKIFQLGYDINGVSNNLLDYIIQAGSNYYDPNNITDYLDGVSTGLRYQFNYVNGGARQPPPNTSTVWSLYFGSNSGNTIRDTYNTDNNVYLGSNVPIKPLQSTITNEHVLVNWFRAGNTNQVERFLTPAIDDNYATKISTTSVFLPCINKSNPLVSDSYTDESVPDLSGVSGMSFFLPPSKVVKLDSLLIGFGYIQPSRHAGQNITRYNSALNLGGIEFNNALYQNQTTEVSTDQSDVEDWDDWFLYNRRNLKLGIFNTADIQGVPLSTIQLSNAMCTMTLDKITQAGNYQNQLGTLRTREPNWATYYTYRFENQSKILWDANAAISTSMWASSPDVWRSTIVSADSAPTYIAGESVYSNYFQTPAIIYNYTYLPRMYGIAPAVENAYHVPELISSIQADIPNSYTAVPFYYEKETNTWKVGSFYGLSYTQEPAMAPVDVIGAAPYYGPPGVFGWTNRDGRMELHNGQRTGTFERFYWNTKVQFEVAPVDYNPATDLALFGGFDAIKEEYQDTIMFFYENDHPRMDIRDLSTTTVDAFDNYTTYWRWGMESNVNYLAYDDQSGYNYLSYIHNVPVRPGKEYALHVRSYSPVPAFDTGIRFIGKNFTDFGRPTLWEIAQEISSVTGYTPITDALASQMMTNYVNNKDNSLYSSTIKQNNTLRLANGNFFSYDYAGALVQFNTAFSTSATFGKKIGYNGRQFTMSGYQNAMTQYIEFFSSIRALITTYTTILSTATGQLNTYVGTKYKSVLPSSIINRNRITDPLPFQLLFESTLEPPFDGRFDEWGLGWNLGFNKADTIPRITHTSDTFIRIVQDYIYLRLNPELNMNTMSVSGKEDRSLTNESSGEEQKYFSKIILNNFGGFCRAAVQLPKNFNPILGKYETVSCQLVDKYGVAIDNADCEYDFVLEVTEITNVTNDGSTLLATDAMQKLIAERK